MDKSALRTLYAVWIGGLILLILLSVFVSRSLRAETVATETTTTSPAPSRITGMIDLRPSFRSRLGSFYMENAFELGYKFTQDTSFSYLQAVNNNLYEPKGDSIGLNATIERSFARLRVNNLYKGTDGFSISYENRFYVPVAGYDQEAGMILLSRNYFKFRKQFSSQFALTFMEIPIVQLYRTAGYFSGANARANAAFENRVYLIGEVNFTDKLSLVLPVMFHQTKYRSFAQNARNDDAWTFFFWINPEITYSIDNNFSVGLGYYSDNLLNASGFEDGITQLAFTAAL